MKTYTISASDNRVINVTKEELVEIIRLEGLEKIEVNDKYGWDYIENKMMESGYNWDNEETTAENIARFLPVYEIYLSKESREEEFGNMVNKLDN